jgi:uncharacterized protein DUF664
MTENDRPWEPPLAGTETEHLVGALDRLRSTFRWKADDLDAEGLRARIGASELSLGGLLAHLALVEDDVATRRLDGAPYTGPWGELGYDGPEWEFRFAAGAAPEQLYRLWDDAVARSRERLAVALSEGGVDQLVHLSMPDGRRASLRRLLCDLIEEYGRHTGHADLLREAVDGRVGEDPPDGWRPVCGH